MFTIYRKSSKLIHIKLTPELITMLANCTKRINTATVATSSPTTMTSTRLKIQTSFDRPGSTSLTIFGNRSMQLSVSPQEIASLYPSMLEAVKIAINSEMVGFLTMMRRMDTSLV
jgi:hypothetical protein